MQKLSVEVKNKRFLIVDDAASMRGLLKATLKSFGISRIFEAADGNAALKILQTKPVELIFCDWEMPEKDGLQLFEALKQDEELKHIPFILITSLAELDKVKKAIDVGIEHYIAKPFREDTLLTKINDVFARMTQSE